MTARDLDFVFITETWLNTGNTYVLGEAVPNNFTVFNSPRQIGRGGGLVSIFKDNFICTQLKFDQFSSFELQAFKIQAKTPVLCAAIYRPPRANKDCISELAAFFADIVLKYDNISMSKCAVRLTP